TAIGSPLAGALGPRAPQGGEKRFVLCDLTPGLHPFAPWQSCAKLDVDEPERLAEFVFGENLPAGFDAKLARIVQDAVCCGHGMILLEIEPFSCREQDLPVIRVCEGQGRASAA